MIVLGIDPGTASTGYGVIKKKKTLKCLCYDVIHTKPGLNLGERLRKINNRLLRVIREYKPEMIAIERVYFFRNSKSALAVSQAKGSILLTAAKKRLPVREFTPLQIKKVITGKGRADKKKVQKEVKKMLRLKKIPRPNHAADALAVAITYFLEES